jgi:competence protein ComEA
VLRRVAGAWLLFSLIALPHVVDMAARLMRERFADVPADPTGLAETGGPARSRAGDDGKFIPGANVLPTEKKAPVSPELPPRFVSDPLFFFSTAPPESLALLPGIGPVLAERISDARTGKKLFATWNDLRQVKGIGEKKISRFKRLAEIE